MAQSIEIFWHGKAVPELEPKIQEELAKLLSSGLERASNLIFHSFFLGDHEKDPIIEIWGEKDDHRFHAKFMSKYPKDMIFDLGDLPPGAPLIKAIRKKEEEEE